jgi:hypothetical protein
MYVCYTHTHTHTRTHAHTHTHTHTHIPTYMQVARTQEQLRPRLTELESALARTQSSLAACTALSQERAERVQELEQQVHIVIWIYTKLYRYIYIVMQYSGCRQELERQVCIHCYIET